MTLKKISFNRFELIGNNNSKFYTLSNLKLSYL